MQFQCQFTQINCLVADSRKRSRGLSARVPQSGTLALSSVWHLALWHSALFGTWHFGTQLCLALGTLALSSIWHLALWHSALFGTWHSGTRGWTGTWQSRSVYRLAVDGGPTLCRFRRIFYNGTRFARCFSLDADFDEDRQLPSPLLASPRCSGQGH